MKEKAIEMMNAVYSDDEKQKKKIEDTREAFATVAQFVLENMKDSREKSLVLTKLEEACMWTIKDITREKQNESLGGNNSNASTNAFNEAKTIDVKLNADEEFANKCEQKKEENIKDILDYMDSIAEDQKEIIDLSLTALKKKLKNPDAFTSVKDIATVYGVIFDKAMKLKEIRYKQNKDDDLEDDGVVIINDCPTFEKEETND